jgi:hypothetical protein
MGGIKMNEILAKLTEAINIQVDNVNIAREINFMVTQLIVAVEKEVEKKWADTDLQEFAEWCSGKGYSYKSLIETWFGGIVCIESTYSISELQEIWEIETGRRPKP